MMQGRKITITIILNILILALALFLKPKFQTNDDIGMIYAYSGSGIFETSTPVTAFSTKIFGIIMVYLYKITPINYEVYTIFLFLFIFISNVLIQIKILTKIKLENGIFWMIIISLLTFISLYFYLELQFTMVTGLLCLAGSLLISKNAKWLEYILGFFLITIACLIRPSAVPIILTFILFLNIAYSFIHPIYTDSKKEIFIKYFSLLGLALCIYFLDSKIHNLEERKFLDFNVFRAEIVDFNISSVNNNLPLKWDKEELDLFKNWFYNDSILYSKNINYSLALKNSHSGFLDKVSIHNLNYSLLINQFRGPIYRCIFILALIPIIVIKGRKKYLLVLLTTIFIYILYYLFLSLLFKEPPFRLSFLLFTVGIISYLNIILSDDYIKYLMDWRLFICVPILLYGLWITKISMDFRLNDLKINYCKETYNSKIMYIRWRDYPYDYENPFTISQSMKGIKLVSMGAFSVHPNIKNHFGNFKYSNLTNDVIGKDSIVSFLLPLKRNVWKNLENAYTKFLLKQYKKNVYFQQIDSVKHCFGYGEFKLKVKTDETKLD